MKNLLYKEFRLAIRPSVYIFFALAALLLVPSYPYYVSFFYLTLGIFLTFKTNRAENDIFYSAQSFAHIINIDFKLNILSQYCQ